MEIVKFEVKPVVSFLEYVFGGCRINMHVAIDFTMSNGDPRTEPNSLHSLREDKNQYLQALRSVGEILQYYDHDKNIPAYGFGAVFPQLPGVALHKFALNGDAFKPSCNGIDEVVQCYRKALNTVTLHGPTNFADVIGQVNDRVEACEVSAQNQEYHVLLILTDGVITDLQKTIDQVVRASRHNVSIIIVGVGNADFEAMDKLDADTHPLYSSGLKQYAKRDIVQFVPFSDFKHDRYALAKAVLEELPGQVTDYFVTQNIMPAPSKSDQREAVLRKLTTRANLE